MRTRVKIKEGEKLTSSDIKNVISLLEREKPITKKEACEILNISYNTTRLAKIIESHLEEEAYIKNRRKELKKTPVTETESKGIVEDYLSEISLQEISNTYFRSVATIKNILRKYGVPFRSAKYTYSNPPLIDENFISKDYAKGDLVFAARYNCCAYVEKSYDDKQHEKIFRIRLIGQNRRQAIQPYYELIDFRLIQQKLQIKLHELSHAEINNEIAKAIINSRKKKHKDD